MLSLRFAEETFGINTESPEHLVFRPQGRLVLTELDEDENNLTETEVGRFALTILDIESATEEGVAVFDLCDMRSETMDCFEVLFDSDTEEFSDDVALVAFGSDYPLSPNLLLFDRLEIFEGYRGQELGLTACELILARFRSSVGLVAAKPYPLQFEAGFEERKTEEPRLGKMSFGLSKKDATTKLRRHYGRLGFKHVPSTEYMVRT